MPKFDDGMETATRIYYFFLKKSLVLTMVLEAVAFNSDEFGPFRPKELCYVLNQVETTYEFDMTAYDDLNLDFAKTTALNFIAKGIIERERPEWILKFQGFSGITELPAETNEKFITIGWEFSVEDKKVMIVYLSTEKIDKIPQNPLFPRTISYLSAAGQWITYDMTGSED